MLRAALPGKGLPALRAGCKPDQPEDGYRFKPTPEIQDFGQRMAHVIGFNMRNCAHLKGEQKPLTFSAAPTMAEIAVAMKQTSEECDAVYDSLTNTEVLKTMTGGRGGPRLKLAVIEGPLLEHSQEMYGYMAVYLRMKGIVPPSSDHNERQIRPGYFRVFCSQ